MSYLIQQNIKLEKFTELDFAVYFELVKNIKATTLSLTTVLTPIIALGVGAYFNNEALTTMIFVGAFVLLTGLFIYFYKDLMLAYKVKK